MNETQQFVLMELKELKEFYYKMGISNPVLPLLIPLMSGLAASHIIWAIYVLWVERPILVNLTYMKEEDDVIYAVMDADVEVEERNDEQVDLTTVSKDIDDKSSINERDDAGEHKELDPKENFLTKYWIQNEKTVVESAPMLYNDPSVILASNSDFFMPDIQRNSDGSSISMPASEKFRPSAVNFTPRKKKSKKSKKSLRVRQSTL